MNKNIRQYIKMFKFNSVYYRIFVLLICIIMLPSIFIGIFIYAKASSSFQQEINKHNLYALDYIRDETVNMLNSADIISMRYSLSSNFKYFINKSLSSDRTQVNTIYEDINNSILTNPFIDSIYIYYKNSDELITSNGVFALEDFYDRDWLKNLDDTNDKPIFLPTRNIIQRDMGITNVHQVITLIRPFPMQSNQQRGIIVINVKVEDTQSKIGKIAKQENGYSFIIDEHGKILMSNKSYYDYRNLYDLLNIKLDQSKSGCITGNFLKQKVLISYTSSPISGWRFVQLTPLREINKNIIFIRNILIISVIIITLIAMILSLFISNKVYNYLVLMIDTINGKNLSDNNKSIRRIKNEADVLQAKVKDIFNSIEQEKKKNVILKEQMSQNKNVMLKSFFKDLILCCKIESNEIQKRLTAFEWPDGNHIVMILCIDNVYLFEDKLSKADQSLWKDYIVNISKTIINKNTKGIIFEDNFNAWIIVLNLPDRKDDTYKKAVQIADEIRYMVNKNNLFTISIAIGSKANNINFLKNSYSDAVKVLQEKWI